VPIAEGSSSAAPVIRRRPSSRRNPPFCEPCSFLVDGFLVYGSVVHGQVSGKESGENLLDREMRESTKLPSSAGGV
jgi:hypothetical protein